MIKLIKSTFFNEELTKRRLCEFIAKAETLSMSAECKKFEESFAVKQGRKFGVFVNSGSSANLLLIQSLLNIGRLKKGDIVGVSALTWSTNIMPLIQLGLQVLLIDCEVNTLNVSRRTLEKALQDQPNVKAFFATNTLGFAGDLKNIRNFCAERKIIFLEDNCEALGSTTEEYLLGNFGLASTFSFFVGHHLSTIEGGMVCTDDEDLYHALLIARSHGWDRHHPQEAQKKLREAHGVDDFFAKYTFYDLGYNVRPSEINGFLGNEQLKYWNDIVGARDANFRRLHEVIVANPELVSIEFGHMGLVSNFAIPVIAKTPASLNFYKKLFQDNQVEIRPMIAGNMARQPFFRKYVSNPGRQENAEFIHDHSFYFGNNPELTEEELKLFETLLSKRSREKI